MALFRTGGGGGYTGLKVTLKYTTQTQTVYGNDTVYNTITNSYTIAYVFDFVAGTWSVDTGTESYTAYKKAAMYTGSNVAGRSRVRVQLQSWELI